MNIVNSDPEIIYYDDFITDEECKFIIDVSKGNMERAKVSDDSININTYKGRTNKSYWIPLDKYDIMKKLCIRIAIQIGFPFKHFEQFQVIHYSPGEEYKYHYDAYDIKSDTYEKYCGERGNRVKTVLCYINDVEEGGETAFDCINGRTEPIIIKPVKGRMVVFFKNINEDGSINTQSRHAGLPVISGEKWAFNLWVREK